MKSAPSLSCCADNGHQFVGIIRMGRVRQHVLFGVVADGVFMPAENVDRIAADAHARPGNLTLVDGVAHGGVGRSRALGAHVALGSEASHQVIARGKRRNDRALRNRFFNRLQIFGARVQEQMHMRVDEAGQQSGVAKIDDLSAGRARNLGPDFFDYITLDENLTRCSDVSRSNVEQTRSV